MSKQETNDFDELEALLSSAQKHAEKMRERSALHKVEKTVQNLSEDYAERLAEKAIFRRLLADEALDGVRFRWLWQNPQSWDLIRELKHLDAVRAYIDSRIAAEEGRNGSPG
jgi:hypothetical protein